MQLLYRHIITTALAGILLFGQTGLSLHQIYCFCKGQWEASLFATAEGDGCDSHETEESHPLPPCCEDNAGCSLNAPPGQHMPCKEDVVVYMQLDIPATPVSFNTWNHHSDWIPLNTFPSFTLFFPTTPAPRLMLADRAPPSPRDGRFIRIWGQSFLC